VAATGAAATRSVAAAEVALTGTGEVVVKEPEHISTGLVRMVYMLAGKTTLDRATMLHSEFPIAPTWRANCQGGETWIDLLGATQAVCRLMGESGTKSVGGSSHDELGTWQEWQWTQGFRLVQASREKPYI
jgi:hypothetical protein